MPATRLNWHLCQDCEILPNSDYCHRGHGLKSWETHSPQVKLDFVNFTDSGDHLENLVRLKGETSKVQINTVFELLPPKADKDKLSELKLTWLSFELVPGCRTSRTALHLTFHQLWDQFRLIPFPSSSLLLSSCWPL